MMLVLLTACASGMSDPHSHPVAVDGRLDLTHWDFVADGDVALLGTWEICWNRLLEPGKSCPSGWRPVPVRGLWSEADVASPFGGRGVATYRLHVELPAKSERLSILAGGPLTAYRLWLNGVERDGLGRVGPTAETTEAEVLNRVYEQNPGARELEIQVQVANFEFRGGGLRRI
jgi:hypothetical protein